MRNPLKISLAGIRLLAAFFVIATMVSPATAGTAEAAPPPDYVELKGSWPAGEADVVEFFSYNCSFCDLAEPAIAEFMRRKPATLRFQRYAISSKAAGWSLSAEAFRAAHLAGIEPRVAPLLFDRMRDEKGVFADLSSVRAFFDQAGVGAQANKYLESPESLALRKHIFKLAQGVSLTKTPTFIVGGRYVVYWGTHHTPESFTALLLDLHRRATKPAVAGCAVTALDEDAKGPVKKPLAACK